MAGRAVDPLNAMVKGGGMSSGRDRVSQAEITGKISSK